jgi:hypothetical protein
MLIQVTIRRHKGVDGENEWTYKGRNRLSVTGEGLKERDLVTKI